MMTTRTFLALGTAATFAVASIVSACSGFSSGDTVASADASTETDAVIVSSDVGADVNTPFCDTAGDHFVCADFDKNDVSFGFDPSYSTQDGAAIFLSQAGAVSKPYAAAFTAFGSTFTSITLEKKFPSPTPTHILVRGYVTFHETQRGPASALIVTSTKVDGGALFLSVQFEEKINASTLIRCRLAQSQSGGSGDSVECDGDALRDVPQAFTLDMTTSVASFSLQSAGGVTVSAKRDFASFGLSDMSSLRFGVQSSFSGGTADAGTWGISFDNLTVDILP